MEETLTTVFLEKVLSQGWSSWMREQAYSYLASNLEQGCYMRPRLSLCSVPSHVPYLLTVQPAVTLSCRSLDKLQDR